MQPYQKAAEALRHSGEYPINLLKNVGMGVIGGGAAKIGSKALAPLIGQVGALLSNYVPDEISRKGLGKVDSRFNKFIDGALSAGYTYDDLRSFIGDKINKTNQEQEKTKDNRNIIQQYSDQLYAFLEKQVNSGRSPLEAGALAQLDEKFKRTISKMEEDHKTNWSSILQNVFGGQDQSKAALQENPVQPQQPIGNGDDELVAKLQSILRM